MNDSLLSGGKHYNLMINWKKRLANEIPFLKSFFDGFLSNETSILSVGCGTGQHLFEIQKHYQCEVTGIDISETMIDEAQKQVPKGSFLVGDFLDNDVLSNQKFDAIFSLGNSIGLIASVSSFLKVVKKLKTHIKPNGILIFQLLNTMKEREGWSPPRSVKSQEGEYIFLRGFHTSKEFIHPEILTLFRANDSDQYQIAATGGTNIPRITVKAMKELLNVYNFENIEVYGNYQKEDFDPSTSLDMIFIARSKT